MTLIKKIEDLSPIKKKIIVTLAAKAVLEASEKAYVQIGKKAKIKGFREGKVPRKVLEQYYKPEADKETVQSLIDSSYPEAVAESKLLPVSYPEIKVTAFDESPGHEKGLSYEATFEIRPTIEITGYQGLKLSPLKDAVTDKEIEERLGLIQDRMAQIAPVPATHELATGDIVTLNYAGTENGKNFTQGTVKNYRAEIGKGQLLADFEKQILGLKKADRKTIALSLPKDFSDKNLAGKAVSYEVEVVDIRAKKLPALNDDFAKDVGLKSLTEVKDKIKEDLKKEKANKNRITHREEIVDQLVKKNKFEVPEGMIMLELEGMWRNFVAYLKQQGLSPEKAGIKPEDFVKNNREVALKRVQMFLLFDAIADKEKITITPEEVDQKLEAEAKASNQSPVILKQQYKARNLIPQFTESLRGEKILDFVLEAAKVKTK